MHVEINAEEESLRAQIDAERKREGGRERGVLTCANATTAAPDPVGHLDAQ